MKYIMLLLIILIAPLLNACGDKVVAKPADYRKPVYYVDKAKFAKGRPCAEVLFKCLPESQDKGWQNEKQNEENAIDFFELTPEVTARYKKVVKDWSKKYEENSMDPYVISTKDKAFFDEVEHKQFLKEMEESLGKEFPGFWRDVPKPVRYRWLRRAMSKGDKYGYKLPEYRGKISMIELCARIGLDFDLDPKWENITKFIALPKSSRRNYVGSAVDYVGFTIFEKDINRNGHNLTDWSLQTALRYLPYPKRPVPSLK
ncbi:MAG: hypothetical protein L3J51_12080 [Cocleimonas sp.]|nr:hypothetical protein [Cocleimonas sp.]